MLTLEAFAPSGKNLVTHQGDAEAMVKKLTPYDKEYFPD